MKYENNIKDFLDSIDLNLSCNENVGNSVTLRDCIKQDLKIVATKIIEAEYGLTRNMFLCIINDFTHYWMNRVKDEENMVYCDSCGDYLPLHDVVEGVYDDNGEHYNYTCKRCNDNGVSRFNK